MWAMVLLMFIFFFFLVLNELMKFRSQLRAAVTDFDDEYTPIFDTQLTIEFNESIDFIGLYRGNNVDDNIRK